MIKYRPHRASLADAMKEYQEFDSVADMFAYIQQNSSELINANNILIGESLGSDDRIGWKSTRYVLVKQYGSEYYEQEPICIGMCDLGEKG